MELRSIDPNTYIGINFSKINSATLDNLGFKKVNVSSNLRSKNAERNIYRLIRPHIKDGDIVIMVLPQLNLHIPIILMMVYGITKNLPYTIYFDHKNDPDLQRPLVYSLPDIKYKSEQAALLNTEYFKCA